MTWKGRELAIWRFFDQYEKKVDVESSAMRKAVGLGWHLRPGDERMAAEELGRCIDDCLVEIIGSQLRLLKKGYFSIEVFESRMRKFDSLVKTRFEEVPAISHICALPYVGVVYGIETVYCTLARVRLF